jgi:hypothetical protein
MNHTKSQSRKEKMIKQKKSHSLVDLSKKRLDAKHSVNLSGIRTSNISSTAICKFCTGPILNPSFAGRFCSKSCVGRYAQIKSVRSRKLKKMRRNALKSEEYTSNGNFNSTLHSSSFNRSSINVVDINSSLILNEEKDVELEKELLLKRKKDLLEDNVLNSNTKKMKENVNDENEDLNSRMQISFTIDQKKNLNCNNNANSNSGKF